MSRFIKSLAYIVCGIMPNVGFIGVAGSGKAHAITLLGITAVELNLQTHADRKCFELMRCVMNGIYSPILMLPPEMKTTSCKIHISFPKWVGLVEKKVTITLLDISGEVLRLVIELMKDARTIREIIESLESKGVQLEQDEVRDIQDILSADGYILIVDANKLISQSSEDRMSQNLSLTCFMRNLRQFRERARLGRVRGVAVFLTKTDQTPGKRPQSEGDVEEIIRSYAPGLIAELNELKAKGGAVRYFYSYLDVEVSEGRPRARIYMNRPIYSQDQYKELLWWIRNTF